MNTQRLPYPGFSGFKKPLAIAAFGLSVAMAGCSSDDDNGPLPVPEAAAGYEITVTNLTAGQPLSPIAVVLHNSSWQSFATGSAASDELEQLAEGGDNSAYLNSASSSTGVHASAGGTGVILPGSSETIALQVAANRLDSLALSLVSMLVNTNDAFASINNQSIATLSLGDSMSFNALSYDSGTEANSEAVDSIPGPAAAGGAQEGYNANRDDVRDAIYVHPGVVTADDGFVTSVLTQINRWDHPAMRVTIARVQ